MDTGSYEFLKRCAARYVWARRNQLTPSSRREREKERPNWGSVLTWRQWWERKFNDVYNTYMKSLGVNA